MASFKDNGKDPSPNPAGFFMFIPGKKDASNKERRDAARDLWEWLTQDLLEEAIQSRTEGAPKSSSESAKEG